MYGEAEHELTLRDCPRAASIPRILMTSIKTDKKNCIQEIRARVQAGQLNRRFVEDNVAVFRSLSGSKRKQLKDVAIKIDLPKLIAKDDPVTQFFLNEFKTLTAGQSYTKEHQAFHFEHEEMALDWEHCGVLEIGQYDFNPAKLTFKCTQPGGLFKMKEGEGTLEVTGRYKRFIKCYKDFKEESTVRVPREIPKMIFRGQVTRAQYTPEKIEYIVGEKKRSLKWGNTRVNLYKVESGTVKATTEFTQKNHPDYDQGGTVA